MTIIYIMSALLITAAAALLVLSYRIFTSFALRREGKKDYVKAYGNQPGLPEYHKEQVEYFRSLRPRKLKLKSDCELVGWYHPSPDGKLAVLIHGWRDDCTMRMAYARPWIEAGYGVFIPDLRSHGASGGKYIGMGCIDRGDIIEWIKLLQSKGEERFVLSGVSMGGATVCALSGDRELPECVCAVISDCAFSSVRELFVHLMRKKRLPGRLVTALVSFWCRLIAGYGFSTDTPVEQVKRSKIPTLFIHGEADTFVPFEMCRKLYDACGAEHKEYWPVPDTAHARSFWVAREQYAQRCVAFADRFTEKQT